MSKWIIIHFEKCKILTNEIREIEIPSGKNGMKKQENHPRFAKRTLSQPQTNPFGVRNEPFRMPKEALSEPEKAPFWG